MEWTNDVVMEFLDLYEGEPVIWNPTNDNHKDKNFVYEAWKRIQSQLSVQCSLKELKKKKDSLMASYRKVHAKVRSSGKTGSATCQVYKPEWFAYNKMASFMHTAYTPRTTTSSEIQEQEHDIHGHSSDVVDEAPGTASQVAGTSTGTSRVQPCTTESEDESTNPSVFQQGGPPVGKKRKGENKKLTQVEERMDTAYNILKQTYNRPKIPKDESSLFCDLLCTKLRALDDVTRDLAMQEINNLMFNLKHRNNPYHMTPTHHSHQPYPHYNNLAPTGNIPNLYSPTAHGSSDSSHYQQSPAATARSSSSTPTSHFTSQDVTVLSDGSQETTVAELFSRFNSDSTF